MALLNKIVRAIMTFADKCFKHIGGMPSSPLENLLGSFFKIRAIEGGLQNG